MRIKLIQKDNKSYVQGQSGTVLLRSEQDVISLLEHCTESNLVMLHASNFAPEFFDLSSGLLGKILLKFTTYHVKLAIVLPPEQPRSEQFDSMAREANEHNSLLSFFPEQNSARQWLLDD